MVFTAAGVVVAEVEPVEEEMVMEMR